MLPDSLTNGLARTAKPGMTWGMDATAKIFKFIDVQGLSDAEFCEQSNISKSFVSGLRSGKTNLTLKQVQRAAKTMKVSIDWLLDEKLGWPPPPMEERIILTDHEKRILDIAREVSSGDPKLERARLRLLRLEFLPGTVDPDEQPAPKVPSYEDEKKAAQERAAKGGNRKAL